LSVVTATAIVADIYRDTNGFYCVENLRFQC